MKKRNKLIVVACNLAYRYRQDAYVVKSAIGEIAACTSVEPGDIVIHKIAFDNDGSDCSVSLVEIAQ